MKQREHWGTRFGFIMATAGSAIGLGSFWKFPYVTGVNGGGLFVLLYLFFTFFIGVPIFIGELLIGRRTHKGPVGALVEITQDSSTNWKMAGWLTVVTNFIIFSYYNVVAGWTLNYALLSLMQFTQGRTDEQIRGVYDTMYQAPDVNIFWHACFMFLTAGIVYGGIKGGIEYWTKLLTPALFALVLALFFYGTTLDGFDKALEFVFMPKWEAISAAGILQALGLSFFTLSVGLGILVAYGSYMKKDADIPGTAMLIAVIEVSVSLVAALIIFPITFSFGLEPQAGVGLVFQTLPVLFSRLPGCLIISTAFFVLLIFTTLTSTISLLEALVANIMELWDFSRRKATCLCALCVFLFGIPSALSGSKLLFPNWEAIYGMSFFATMSEVTDRWFLPLGGLFMALFVGWVVSPQVLREEFGEGSSYGKLFSLWFFLIRYLAPLAIIMVMCQESGLVDFDRLAVLLLAP